MWSRFLSENLRIDSVRTERRTHTKPKQEGFSSCVFVARVPASGAQAAFFESRSLSNRRTVERKLWELIGFGSNAFAPSCSEKVALPVPKAVVIRIGVFSSEVVSRTRRTT